MHHPDDPDEPGVRVLGSRSVFRGRVLDLALERVRFPNGHVSELEIVRHPGAAAVVPVEADGNVVLVRQYRHAAGGWLLEIPAGKLDAGEDPLVCARRECAEEVALEPATLRPLGTIYPTPGFADETIALFLGTDLEPVAGGLEADELLEVVRLPLERAVALAAGGQLEDAKSALAILRAARALVGDG